MVRLAGQVALVTGGARGLVEAQARILAAEGAQVRTPMNIGTAVGRFA